MDPRVRVTGSGYDWFVGIDWATAAHQICVLDAAGMVVSERLVEHNASDLAAWLSWLSSLINGKFDRVAVGIEIPRGAVIEILMERGIAVYTINPKQVDRFRDRLTMAGAKDDRRDARIISGALRTDLGAFRRLASEDPRVIQLREVARAGEDLAEEANRLTNRLREQIHRIAPDWLALCPNAGEAWFWALLDRLDTAEHLQHRTVERLLRAHRIRRVSAKEVVAILRHPAPTVAPGTIEAVRQHIGWLLPRLRLVNQQRLECKKALDVLLAALGANQEPPAGPTQSSGVLPDVAIARSLPGIGRMVCATIFAEAAHLIQVRNLEALRALGGLAPVTRQSGNKRVVAMRRACNKRLRAAFYHWARTSTMFDQAAKAYYTTLRQRGHSHGRALRSVADRGLRILIAMLKSTTRFDPSRVQIPLKPVQS